jgi:hypothetical protein
LEQHVLKNNYDDRQNFSVDETGPYWKKMPSRTLVAKNESVLGYKVTKDRLTLVCSEETLKAISNCNPCLFTIHYTRGLLDTLFIIWRAK